MRFIEKLKKSEAGFTLMEVLLAMVLFGILSVTVGTLLSNTISTNKRLTEKSMKLEDARIAMDFIQTHIKAADTITITGTTELTTTEVDPVTSVPTSRTFKLDGSKIEFGGNVLAQDVDNLKLERKANDILCIEIAMKAGTGYGPLKLVGEVNVKYK